MNDSNWPPPWFGAIKRKRLRIYVEPRDIWVGAYISNDAVYVCPLPLLVFRWQRRVAP